MTDKEIIEAIKQKENGGAEMGSFFDELVSDGVITYEKLRDLIGWASDAYPKGFPGYYDHCPDFSTIRQTQIRIEKNGGRIAFVL